jgi:hypothetical protein
MRTPIRSLRGPRLRLLPALAALVLPGLLAAQRPAAAPTRLADDLRFLAADALEGRLTGSPGADSAAAYLARRFAEVGLQPTPEGWYQEFEVSPRAAVAQHAGLAGKRGRNVIGILPGHDPVRRHETVVLGAHYDHLGRGGFGALDPDSAGRVHNGADDNASGTAALIHVASQLAKSPPARTVVFVAFDGEELGLLGSAAYVKQPPFPLSRVLAMINLDMVGRLRSDRLIAMGTGTAKEFVPLLDSLNWYAAFDLRKQPDGWGRSDQSSFLAAKRPVLFLFTDLHEDYHRATDDVERLNLDGLKRVVDFTASLTATLADRKTPLTFVDVPQPKPVVAATAGPHGPADPHGTRSPGGGPLRAASGYGAYLGTIPDMADAPEGGGVRLSGVRAGSPAERAGLRADDVVTRIGPHAVADLQAMTDALRSLAAGDEVEITIVRGGATRTVRATLGTRGG